MKLKKDIIKQRPVYLNIFTSKVDVVGNFEDVYINDAEYKSTICPYPNTEMWLEKKKEMENLLSGKYKDIKILFASYGCANYSGDAFVLFVHKGQLYEVNGSHCSCYGLEGQWSPEKVVLKELKNRLVNGTFGTDDYSDNNFATELKKYLGIQTPNY